MLTYRQWGSQNVTAANLGTTISITRPPQQYPISKISVILRGQYTIGAVGAVDYVAGDEFMKRQVSRIQFQLGSANFLKDTPGYSCSVMTATHNPAFGADAIVASGSTFTTGDVIDVFASFVVEFADPNSINGGNSTLIPSLYPDLQLNVALSTLADLCTAGDWDYTFTGALTVTVEQVTDLKVNVNTLLKEFTQVTDVTATGQLAIDMPTSILVSEFLLVPLVDGVPSLAGIDSTGLYRINVESGTVILDERYLNDVQVNDYLNYGVMYPLFYLMTTGTPAPYLHWNLDHNHDGREMFDNRQVKKWQLEVPAVFIPGSVTQMLIHFVGKTPVRS